MIEISIGIGIGWAISFFLKNKKYTLLIKSLKKEINDKEEWIHLIEQKNLKALELEKKKLKALQLEQEKLKALLLEPRSFKAVHHSKNQSWESLMPFD